MTETQAQAFREVAKQIVQARRFSEPYSTIPGLARIKQIKDAHLERERRVQQRLREWAIARDFGQ